MYMYDLNNAYIKYVFDEGQIRETVYILLQSIKRMQSVLREN